MDSACPFIFMPDEWRRPLWIDSTKITPPTFMGGVGAGQTHDFFLVYTLF